jgi:hypothetical protein
LRMAMAVAGFTGGQAEDLRRAMGFKRSEKRMKQLEGLLREGMAKHGITGDTADRIVLSITSFALYGFPESHAASFALIAYASAYFKMHYPAAFYTALLNNQPMGFYHPATLVKDAQRRGVRFRPIDVQVSRWECTVEADGAIRLGLRYVTGLRQEVGMKIGGWAASFLTARGAPPPLADHAASMSLGLERRLSASGVARGPRLAHPAAIESLGLGVSASEILMCDVLYRRVQKRGRQEHARQQTEPGHLTSTEVELTAHRSEEAVG